MEDFVVVKEHKHLIPFIDQLQRKNADALAFLPRIVFEREAPKGRLFLGLLNGAPCGYAYVGSKRSEVVRCHQVCIEYDARRRLYGAAIVAAIEEYAEGASAIRLRCGFDLEANEFWRAMGYSCTEIVPGGVRRMRQINIWEKDLSGSYKIIAIEPAKGQQDASLWRRNKQTGLVTQFVRGKRLADYRAKLIAKETS